MVTGDSFVFIFFIVGREMSRTYIIVIIMLHCLEGTS